MATVIIIHAQAIVPASRSDNDEALARQSEYEAQKQHGQYQTAIA